MITCYECKKDYGGNEQPAIYAGDYCRKCIDSTDPYLRGRIDVAVNEGKQFLKRYLTGTYMKPREDILSYGKKD